MYCGYIVKLKDGKKHPNADKLKCWNIFGNQVITDLSYNDDQMVVYFPSDGQLSEEFCNGLGIVKEYKPVTEFNKEEIDPKQIVIKNGVECINVGGYMEPEKRNVKAIKLRGEFSDGIVLPVETLSRFTDVSKLNVGDQIDTLNGREICRKYIPKKKQRSQGNKTGVSKNRKELKYDIRFPFFCEHKDTAQLAYNEHAFHEGDLIYLTRKVHGCFSNGTIVNIWGESKGRRITSVKPGDYVIGYKDGEFVPSKVINIWNNGSGNGDWREIRINRFGFVGEKQSKIIATPEHLFFDFNTNNYIKAKDLKPHNVINMVKQTYLLSDKLKSMFVGMYLGDSSIYFRKHESAKLEFGYKKDHYEYLLYFKNILKDMMYIDKNEYISGYGTKMRIAHTVECPTIYQFFKEILAEPNDKGDKLTDKIIYYFDELSLAFLYMDDGSLSHSDFQQDRCQIALCDYNDHDVDIIQKCLLKLGINSRKFYTYNAGNEKKHNRIAFNLDDANKLFDIVKKYMPDVMRYKLPENLRSESFEYPDIEIKKGYVTVKEEIISNNPINIKSNKYDLQTETGNYCVGGILVHNSSGRTGHLIKETKHYNILTRLFHLRPRITKEYDYVSGTRRTTLRTYDGGYYGDNSFRIPYHNFFVGKLPKGMEVFYEICGWINETTPIMPSVSNSKIKDKEFEKQYGKETVFTYGCEPGKSRMFVYRITMTNEDGVVFELPTEQCIMWCEKWGCEFVPVLEKFFYTTWEDLNQRVEKWLDIPEPLADGKHIVEGVCIRIDNKDTFKTYKAKGRNFKILENIIKDDADAPDIEEAEELIAESDQSED